MLQLPAAGKQSRRGRTSIRAPSPGAYPDQFVARLLQGTALFLHFSLMYCWSSSRNAVKRPPLAQPVSSGTTLMVLLADGATASFAQCPKSIRCGLLARCGIANQGRERFFFAEALRLFPGRSIRPPGSHQRSWVKQLVMKRRRSQPSRSSRQCSGPSPGRCENRSS